VAEGLEPLAIEDLGRRQRTPQSLRTRIQISHGAFGGAGIAIGAAVAIALGAASYWSRASTPALEVEPQTASTAGTTTAASASSTEQDSPEESKVVALVLSPVDARVYRGKNDLGPMPLSIRLRSGQRMDLDVRRPGYRSKTISIDGSEPRKVVQLEPIPGAPRGAVPTALPDPAAARTISFGADAGALVLPAAQRWDSKPGSADAGVPRSRPTPTERAGGRPVATLPAFGDEARPTATPPPGPRPRAAESDIPEGQTSEGKAPVE
jgi:hypothetical protein